MGFIALAPMLVPKWQSQPRVKIFIVRGKKRVSHPAQFNTIRVNATFLSRVERDFPRAFPFLFLNKKPIEKVNL